VIDLSMSDKIVPSWILVCNVDYAPHTWAVQDFPYYKLFQSREEGLRHVRQQNRVEPGFFPRGSYQLWYGIWSQDRIERLAGVLQEAATEIY
jgi:hypothetical protein